MQRETKSGNGLSVARVVIQAPDWQDSGIGIVVARHPLTLLVPSHLIELIEQGTSHEIQVNGVPYENAKILPTPALQRDHLSVLQFPRKHQRDLTSAHLPKHSVHLAAGQSISLQRFSAETSASGTVIDVREQGDGSSIITDIAVVTGDSGSPLFVFGKLAAICQGMIQHEGAGNAVAVPLSHDSLAELKKVNRRYRISVIGMLMGAFLAVILSFAGFAIYSANSFTIAGIEVSEDGSTVTATNAQAVTLNPSWTRSFNAPIRRSLVLSTETGGNLNRVAIGTQCDGDTNGAITLLNSTGRPLWSYSVPDGECVYSGAEREAYNGFLVDRIYTSDLDQDGNTELLVVFVHNHFFPCKLVVFSMSGDILAEHWHPGYIRTIETGKVGTSEDVLVVVSASNNALKTDFWNPQTLFAFRGLDISGQAPLYTGTVGDSTTLAPSRELWTWVIINVDPLSFRATCTHFNITDVNGDGLNEIEAPLSDGRFYYFNEFGDVLDTQVGDSWERNFPDTAPPPLVELWEYFAAVQAARAAAEAEAADL